MAPEMNNKLSYGEKKRAYVTFLAGTGDYVKGVVGLAKPEVANHATSLFFFFFFMRFLLPS
jgi:hypothetical protein